MARYILTRAANTDLADIQQYLLDYAPAAESTVVVALFRAFERIGTYPAIGHRRDELAGLQFRFFLVYSYLVVYLAETSPVEIVRIIHAARDVRSELSVKQERRK